MKTTKKSTKKKAPTAKKEVAETKKYSKTWLAAMKSKGSVIIYDPSILGL